jgi:hypothetical protein
VAQCPDYDSNASPFGRAKQGVFEMIQDIQQANAILGDNDCSCKITRHDEGLPTDRLEVVWCDTFGEVNDKDDELFPNSTFYINAAHSLQGQLGHIVSSLLVAPLQLLFAIERLAKVDKAQALTQATLSFQVLRCCPSINTFEDVKERVTEAASDSKTGEDK